MSVELRLINFCSCGFDSQEENHTAPGQLLLTERSDFPNAELRTLPDANHFIQEDAPEEIASAVTAKFG